MDTEDYERLERLFPYPIAYTVQPTLRLDTVYSPANARISPFAPDRILGDLLPNDAPDPEELASREELTRVAGQLLARLSERERRVLELRLGFDGGEGRTLEAIGQMFGLTRERIRQIEQKAIRQLRHPRHSRLLRDWAVEDPGRPRESGWPPRRQPSGNLRRLRAPRPVPLPASHADGGLPAPGGGSPAGARRTAPAPPSPAQDAAPLPAAGTGDLEASSPPRADSVPLHQELLALLPPPERSAMEHRWGFAPPLPLAELTRRYGVHAERLRELDAWLIRELRRPRKPPSPEAPHHAAS